jgi:hypothetical protein
LDFLIPNGGSNSTPTNGSPWAYINSSTGAVGINQTTGGNTYIDPMATGTGIAGNTATLAWSNPTNNIQQQVIDVQQAMVQLTGREMAHVFYGKNIPRYLAQNATVQSYMSKNVVVVNSDASGPKFVQTGEVPAGTLNLNWHPAYKGFFESTSQTLMGGTRNLILGANDIIMCPEPDPDWWGCTEGSYTVPTDVWRKYPEMEAFNAFQMVYGMFSYSIPTMKPPTATMLFGDTFLYILKNPACVLHWQVA